MKQRVCSKCHQSLVYGQVHTLINKGAWWCINKNCSEYGKEK